MGRHPPGVVRFLFLHRLLPLLSLGWIGGSVALVVVPSSPSVRTTSWRLQASYLESLSAPEPDDDDNDNDQGGPLPSPWSTGIPPATPPPPTESSPIERWGPAGTTTPGPKWKAPSGGIPTGRGPQASYLQNMNAGIADTDDDEEEEYEDDEEVPQPMAAGTGEGPAAWSPGYLSGFWEGDDSRTDVRNLLTQRSLQSFLRLLEECRDPHSARWIQEDFLNTGNLLDYHGTGAKFLEDFGGTWEAALLAMSQQPTTRIVVAAKRRGRGHGGWSKNNPFLGDRWVEYPVDVHPASLCDRVLTVREQLAHEWEEDLGHLLAANDAILDSYFERTRAAREAEPASLGGGGGRGDAVYDDDDDEHAFERTAAARIDEQLRLGANSPFRRANFDLLYTLCTQAAIHRLLRSYVAEGREHEVAFVYLKQFYTDRAVDFFDGCLPLGRADEFLDELLRSSPTVLLSSSRDAPAAGLVDPVGTAEEILRMRSVVAHEWRETMGQVPDAHIVVKQSILSEQARASSSSFGNGAEDDAAAFQ